MQFNPLEFDNFLAELTRTRSQTVAILGSAATADEISEVSMILAFQSIFEVLMTAKTPAERVKLIGDLKDLVSTLNVRRDIERKAKKEESPDDKKNLDGQSLKEIETKLNLM